MKRSEAMKLSNIYVLLALSLTLCAVVPATAQTSKKAKQKNAKPATKKSVKKISPAKKASPVKKASRPATAEQKTVAKSLGEAIANAKADTSKKPGVGNGSLSEEIVVTTAYKPVLADAVKIRIKPGIWKIKRLLKHRLAICRLTTAWSKIPILNSLRR